MKIPILLMGAILIACTTVCAQSLSFQQVGSLGGKIGSSNNIGLTHSLGAVASTVIDNNTFRLDQGVFLACDILCDPIKVGTASELGNLSPVVSVYPNPVETLLHLEGHKKYLHRYVLFATDGRIITRAPITQKTISLTTYPQGLYLLKVYGSKGQLNLSQTILKR